MSQASNQATDRPVDQPIDRSSPLDCNNRPSLRHRFRLMRRGAEPRTRTPQTPGPVAPLDAPESKPQNVVGGFSARGFEASLDRTKSVVTASSAAAAAIRSDRGGYGV